MPSLHLEEEVILGALRGPAGNAGAIRELVRRDPDWDVLCESACGHGVLPLLYTRLSDFGGSSVPPGDMARMKDIYSANTRRNLFLGAELLKVLTSLDAQGIVAIPIKGPLLAEAIYGDIALRMFSDLDILVRRDDILRARELLFARGFRPTHAFTRRQEKAHLARTCEFTLETRDGSYQLDVHWRFAADYLAAPLDAEGAFRRRVEGRLLGRPVVSLADEDTLLFLCLHGTFHVWSKLGLICDVARFLEIRSRIDWPALMERAAAAGLRRALLVGLTLAQDFFDAPVPPEVSEAAARDRPVAALRPWVRARIFQWGGRQDARMIDSAMFQMRSKERPADKVRYCLIRSFLPTIEDWKRFPLPDSLYFLYFLLRPVRLTGSVIFC